MITDCKQCGHHAEWHDVDGCRFDADGSSCNCDKSKSDVYIERIRELEAQKDATIYDEISINRVMNYYLKDYGAPDGMTILSREYFIDIQKQVVIFKLRVGKP